MKKTLIFAALCALSLAACKPRSLNLDTIVPEGTLMTFTATTDGSATKTTLSGKHVLWNPGDLISIVYGPGWTDTPFQTDISAPAATTNFSGYLSTLAGGAPDGSTPFTALSPAQGAFYVESDGSIYTYLPESQKASAGTFDPEAFLSVARSRTTELRFHNMCGGIRLRISGDCSDWKSITFHANGGEQIAGNTVFTLDEDGIPVSFWQESLNNEVELLAPEGGFKQDTDYYISTFFGELKEGFSFVVRGSDESRAGVKTYNKAQTIRRSVFGAVTLDASALEWKAGESTPVDGAFLNGQWRAEYEGEDYFYMDVNTSVPGKICYLYGADYSFSLSDIHDYSVVRNVLGETELHIGDTVTIIKEQNSGYMLLSDGIDSCKMYLEESIMEPQYAGVLLQLDGKYFPVNMSSGASGRLDYHDFLNIAESNEGYLPLVYIDAFGGASDYIGKDVGGKVVFVNRGSITFKQKVQNAVSAGAAGVIFVNNAPGEITASIEDATSVPSGSVDQAVRSHLPGKTSVRCFVPTIADIISYLSE